MGTLLEHGPILYGRLSSWFGASRFHRLHEQL